MNVALRPFPVVAAWSRLLALPLCWGALAIAQGEPAAPAAPPAPREFYQDSSWQPRAHPSVADVLRGDFWPASPKVDVAYDTPGFAAEKISPVPAPGVHPRVLLSPSDIEDIRAQVAKGPSAPPEFCALWTRTKESRSAFYALVARDDTLGRDLAAQLVSRLHSLEPKLDHLDAQPDAGNLWSVERSLTAQGDPDAPTEIWTLLDYDYLHGWMSPEDRALAHRVIARLVKNRISNYLTEPDHFMINNHEGFGLEFIRLMLLIEGEDGFPAETFKLSVRKARAMLDWYLDSDGMCYESIKGWLNTSAFVAAGRRDPTLLRHGHLVAKMRFFLAALRWQSDHWEIRDEMRASAFHVIWLMRFLYPENPGYDLLYHATISSQLFLTDAKARWPNPVGVSPELILLFAGGGPADNRAGHRENWTSQAAIDALRLPLTWKDDTRGYIETRNSWRIDDLKLGFTCKQDFFYGGHEGSEANRITLWHGGVNWLKDENLLAVKATSLQNMLTVDGRGLSWPPAPGVWLGVNESPFGVSAAGDAKIAYSYAKVMQVHPLNFPSGKLGYYAPFTEGNFDLTRDQQVAFHPGTVAFNDGYAHTDYGMWSGETRLVENYRTSNPMDRAYRTVHLARGPQPYVLVLDDARKADDAGHLFEDNFNLPDDVAVADAKNGEIVFQNVEPSARRDSEFLLAAPGTPRDPKTGAPVLKKGDPLLLVRVLHRNSDYGYPVPRIQVLPGRPEQPFNRFSQLVVPAIGRSPEFRILFYPHRFGDPLPVTTWNADRTELTVIIKDQRDVYRFGTADGGRTVFDFTRNGTTALANPTPPARPVLSIRGERFDANDLRTTRREGAAPVYPFADELIAGFERIAPPAVIRYTLDGTEPVETSAPYTAPFAVRTTATLKARVFDPRWPGANQTSETLAARLEQRPAPAGLADAPAGALPGLLARVYELPTHLWNDRGFFVARKIMLPDLDRTTPSRTALGAGFTLPRVVPARPIEDQTKGFYRFTGWFRADVAGTYAFAVDSCGPVLLTVAGQDAIDGTGVFHQQQAVRQGSAVLGAGWHPLELIVTDPLFWNAATTGVMPFNVTVRREAGAFAPVPPAALRALPAAETASEGAPPPQPAAANAPVWMEPGVDLNYYDRDGLSRSPDYLDVDALTPRRSERAAQLNANVSPAQVLVHEGWFNAPQDGVYRFDLPSRRSQSAGLGEFRAAYQNQLRIGGEIIVQHGVAGRLPSGEINLAAGWHFVSLRLGSSPGAGTVTYPDGQSLALDGALLSRATQVAVHPAAKKEGRAAWEIFAPASFALSLPEGRDGEIRYTLDGREPTPASPLYNAPFAVTGDTEVKAAVFAGARAQTSTARVKITLVPLPAAALLARVDFTAADGNPAFTKASPACVLWIHPSAKPARTPAAGRAIAVNQRAPDGTGLSGVDINLTRGTGETGFKLNGLHMRDADFTVGVWFRSETADGRLFGKEGLTPFGKSYHTISCSLVKGRLQAAPGHLGGGAVIKPGEWHHVVLTASPETLSLYLDGARVATGAGAPGLATDSLDFFTDHPATIARAAVYNRELEPEEITRWFAAEHPAIAP